MEFSFSVPITNLLNRRTLQWRETSTIGVCPKSSLLSRNIIGLESTAVVSAPANVGLFDVSGRNKILDR